jgi:hypothetical protein
VGGGGGARQARADVLDTKAELLQIGKVGPVVKCRTCKKGRYAPPVHMTETREITPYVWVHPDEKA